MKIIPLIEIIELSDNIKKQNKTVGLVVGSFDILHMGHINLFRLAKSHVDFLVVGLDHDATVSKTKGAHRPINSFKRRSEFLSDLHTVDFVFLIEVISTHGSEESLKTYTDLLKNIKPTHTFTHQVCDRHWKLKKDLSENLGAVCVVDTNEKITSSGDILKKLELEF